MIKGRSLAFVAGVGAWTTLTLSGSISLLFKAVMATGEIPHARWGAVVTFIILLAYFVTFTLIGGCLWGFGIALLTGSDIKALSRAGARIWGTTAVIAGFAIGLSQAPIMGLARATPFDLHTLFTIEFVLAIGLVATLNIRAMLLKLGWEKPRLYEARYAGLAAALGFLIMNLILWFGYGWEVGRPVPGWYSMVTITNLGNLAAALAGGTALGWMLLRGKRL